MVCETCLFLFVYFGYLMFFSLKVDQILYPVAAHIIEGDMEQVGFLSQNAWFLLNNGLMYTNFKTEHNYTIT